MYISTTLSLPFTSSLLLVVGFVVNPTHYFLVFNTLCNTLLRPIVLFQPTYLQKSPYIKFAVSSLPLGSSWVLEHPQYTAPMLIIKPSPTLPKTLINTLETTTYVCYVLSGRNCTVQFPLPSVSLSHKILVYKL